MVRGNVDRRCQEAALISNLPDFHTGDVSKVEDEETGLAAIQEAEAVAALLDVQEWPGVAVHHDHVTEELGVPDRRDIAIRDEWSSEFVEEIARCRIKQ